QKRIATIGGERGRKESKDGAKKNQGKKLADGLTPLSPATGQNSPPKRARFSETPTSILLSIRR
ncbi:MAG TPA: hypothetical protein VL027_04890, partial [Spongiibacteraceae bacterium]|nr:hypothetical protein [Spongiibacteraceae bacterium]